MKALLILAGILSTSVPVLAMDNPDYECGSIWCRTCEEAVRDELESFEAQCKDSPNPAQCVAALVNRDNVVPAARIPWSGTLEEFREAMRPAACPEEGE